MSRSVCRMSQRFHSPRKNCSGGRPSARAANMAGSPCAAPASRNSSPQIACIRPTRHRGFVPSPAGSGDMGQPENSKPKHYRGIDLFESHPTAPA